MSQRDFEESRQWPAESCTELGAEADRAGCGPNGAGTGPLEWLLIGFVGFVVLVVVVSLVAGGY